MKAALVDNTNTVVNVIVWDNTCTAPPGLQAIVVDNSVAVAPGWTWNGSIFINPDDP